MPSYKRRRKRSSKNFVAIPFQKSVALSTLADDAVITVGATGNFGEDIYILSVDATWSLRNLTQGEQPLIVGYAHSDLSTTEVGEALNASLANPDDIIAKERARRPVRNAGLFSQLSTDQQIAEAGGNPKRQKIKFSMGNGFDLDCFVQNKSGAALTTGAIVEIFGTIYGRWQR